jgi:hypothetical protein
MLPEFFPGMVGAIRRKMDDNRGSDNRDRLMDMIMVPGRVDIIISCFIIVTWCF